MHDTSPRSDNPWDWLEPQDTARFGDIIMDPAERCRWCKATLICGLPYMWKHKAGPLRETMYAEMALRPGDRVLLISESIASCGFEEDIRALIGPSGEIHAVDIQETARSTTAAGTRGRGGAIGTWRYDYTAQFPDGHFDCVGVLQAIQHADDWHESARELLRVMKPGRRIMLSEIGIGPQTRIVAEQDLHVEYWMDKLYHGTGRTGPEEVSYYSPEQLHAAFDGLLGDAQSHSWRGADLFWGTKL